MISAKVRYFASPLGHLSPLASKRNPEQAGIEANAAIADMLISQICPDRGTFLDVGAQYGAIFTKAMRHNPTIQVIACEADTAKAEVLRRVHKGVRIIDAAAGEAPGQATFHFNTLASGFSSLVPSTGAHIQKRDVRLVRLDDEIGEAPVDIVKIDVEGAELGVLRGAEQMINRERPTIMFECVMRGENALGYGPDMLWSWLTEHDYMVVAPHRVAHNGPAYSLEVFLDAQEYPFVSHNYFAIPSEARTDVRDKARRILGVNA